ncbi:hypothetical protein [Sphingopyxis sp. RIFCSPHIGHO2_12_FULL_65_19]|uniref:hypothetical protein n=1 Tax=Sphingopyxis sp. RIFCSPHIGHO2_12_FULL_65_19 TaxID=1802172 RepID=UPI0008B864AA|nr:hypothetical protein [Sphingopyxis sp. RIFCSPHIGHO2_12_FULL_65_19]OHD07560.1 MAG: hypothetical protein A3E77_09255 [Sphingopyxis sp. RIFCSPHIGHO2_12_FULL_65_19]
MGILIQRRPFESPVIAQATADWFHEPQFAIPGLTVSTNVIEQDGQIWLVLKQEGAMVTNANAVLPDYQMVSFTP